MISSASRGARWNVVSRPPTVTKRVFCRSVLRISGSGQPGLGIDTFVDELDPSQRGFERVQPASTGRPGYAPGAMLKLYVYGYLHQLTSSRKLSGRVTASKAAPAPRQASFLRCPSPTRRQPRPLACGSRRSSISLTPIPIAALPASSSRPLRPAAVARRVKRRIRRGSMKSFAMP